MGPKSANQISQITEECILGYWWHLFRIALLSLVGRHVEGAHRGLQGLEGSLRRGFFAGVQQEARLGADLGALQSMTRTYPSTSIVHSPWQTPKLPNKCEGGAPNWHFY